MKNAGGTAAHEKFAQHQTERERVRRERERERERETGSCAQLTEKGYTACTDGG